ncbi:MAG: HAMP domain-containing histidine kinase [Erysipelotrichales bacterium]|nr:MAG: HAMP domain-containing histidine kinase [Erysipelotrichales bacterium]
MKFSSRIRIRTWFYFILLTVGILGAIWIFQIAFISSYYRDMKVDQVRLVADKMELGIRTNDIDVDIQVVAVRNNICAVIYNTDGVLLYQVDSIGLGCYLTQRVIKYPQNVNDYILRTQESKTGDFLLPLENNQLGQSMLVYGREIEADFGNYYIFLNSTLEPLDSTVTILKDQFIYVTIVVFFLSSLIAFLFSSRMAKPIVKMNRSAQKLAEGDYKVKFERSEYGEITELADTLNYATEELGKMDELRKDLIANVSHDIKTPLTMIKAYTEMIRDLSGNNPKKREEHLEVILSEVNHLDRLVNDMTKLSQLQANVLELDIKEFDIVELLDHTVSLMKGLIQNENINIEVMSYPKVIAKGDEVKIGQVIYNFLNNAIKHIGEDKKIVLQVLVDVNVRIEVIDHGDGIAEDDVPYIWDRYYKVDKHYQRQTEGTGLGLAIAGAILKAHHAKYGVESKIGEGSMFWFELPLVEVSEN